jgi:pimeloyl-ACP methyl ester carboxylesterase
MRLLGSLRGAKSLLVAGVLAASGALGWAGGANPNVVAFASGADPLSAIQAWRAPQTAELEEIKPAAEPVVYPARELSFPALAERPAYTVYVPAGPDVPRRAVMVLHGMGGSGPGIATQVLSYAQAHDWVVIAPTIPYGDWRDPNQLTSEELRLLPQVARIPDYVRDEAGIRTTGRVMLFGFSRGAQAGLRLAMLYPERVEAVAALSAGTYTVPVNAMRTSAGDQQAPLPFGVADLEQRVGRPLDMQRFKSVRFWIGVGARDDRDADVPRQWDPYIGKNRVERATRFGALLTELACDTQVVVVPNAGHEIVPAMMEHINGFLETSALRAQQAEAAGTARNARPPVSTMRRTTFGF